MKYGVYLLIVFLFTGNALVYAQQQKTIALKNPAAALSSTRYNPDSTLVLIPFEYKQSALYIPYYYTVIDSVFDKLLKKENISLSIDGYAHPDEGSDTICKYLALNRAFFVRDYLLGRGIDSSRIILVRGLSKAKSANSIVDKDGHNRYCRVELHLNFPVPPEVLRKADRDEDGIADIDDHCPDDYGYKENNGCKDSNTIVMPFENGQSFLSSFTYKALDNVVSILKENETYSLTIEGHAYKTEGILSTCERLAMERASIVKNYLLSRNISSKRIIIIKSAGVTRPYNAGKNRGEIVANSRAEILIKK